MGSAIVAVSCCAGLSSYGSDPELRWLRHRPAATAAIRALAWKLTYAVGVAQKKQKKKKKNQEVRGNKLCTDSIMILVATSNMAKEPEI